MVAPGMDHQLQTFFRRIDEHATPLTDELCDAIESRASELQHLFEQDRDRRQRFLATASLRQWGGLLRQGQRDANERQRTEFRDEWYDTLQILRDIAATISQDDNRPGWLPSNVPPGAQADQLLHAHYDNHVIGEGRRSRFAEQFEANRQNPALALRQAVDWRRNLPRPPTGEERTLYWNGAPVLREMVSGPCVAPSEPEFDGVCQRVWSVQDHARRVANAVPNLPEGRPYDMATKTRALVHFLFNRRAQNGSTVLQVIHHVLYDGPDEALPVRLKEATTDGPRRIDHLGISALGELVGWALPEKFPPRNNRTSKSLRSLGFPVTGHGQAWRASAQKRGRLTSVCPGAWPGLGSGLQSPASRC
jgi:hypothetical protein